MKTNLNLTSVIVTAAFFLIVGCNNNERKDTSFSSGDSAHNSADSGTVVMNNMSDNDMMKCMNRMLNNMTNVKMTGDFDVDFANTMIEHHKGAIEMSEEELKSGKDEKMKAMAQRIIDAQKAEVDQLRDFVKNYKPSGMKHGEGELAKSMSNMHEKMNSIQMTGDSDRDFAIMMAAHHEEAVSMSKKELTNGMSAQLKKKAQKIIADQEKEIKEFNDWLNSKK